MNGIENLRTEGISVTVRITLLEGTAPLWDLLACPDFAVLKRLGVPLYFAPVIGTGSYDLKQELKSIGHRFVEAGFEVLSSAQKARSIGLALAACSAVRESDLFVGPSLELYECYADFGHAERSTGNLRSKEPRKKRHYVDVPPPEACTRCAAYALCQAEGCPSALLHGTLIGDARHCVEIKNEIETDLRALVQKCVQIP